MERRRYLLWKRKEKNENPLGTLDIWRWQYPSPELLSCFSCSCHDTVSSSCHCSFWSFHLIVAPVTGDLKQQGWGPVPRTFVSWSQKTWFYLSLFSSFISTSLRFVFFLNMEWRYWFFSHRISLGTN